VPEGPRGTWATVLLPIGEDDRIDWGALEEQVRRLAASGVDGVYTNGSSGEFWAQTEEEFERLTALVADVCGAAGVPFQIGAAHPSPQAALDRLRRARAYGPAAVQVILPDWFAPSDEEACAYLRRMADEAAPVPLVLYNPPHAKRVLTPAGHLRLLDAVPEVVGVKVGDGDAAWYADMAGVCARAAVFVPGHHLATGYRQGAAGAYSNVACLSPEGAVRWWRMITTDPPAAEDVERRLRAFLDAEVLPLRAAHGYCNAALDKLLAAIGGWAPLPTRMRWPYAGVPEELVPDLRARARERLPELLA
jgi:dihydrodipicolinate synthase/N-acetylneuraminate lyase